MCFFFSSIIHNHSKIILPIQLFSSTKHSTNQVQCCAVCGICAQQISANLFPLQHPSLQSTVHTHFLVSLSPDTLQNEAQSTFVLSLISNCVLICFSVKSKCILLSLQESCLSWRTRSSALYIIFYHEALATFFCIAT